MAVLVSPLNWCVPLKMTDRKDPRWQAEATIWGKRKKKTSATTLQDDARFAAGKDTALFACL